MGTPSPATPPRPPNRLLIQHRVGAVHLASVSISQKLQTVQLQRMFWLMAKVMSMVRRAKRERAAQEKVIPVAKPITRVSTGVTTRVTIRVTIRSTRATTRGTTKVTRKVTRRPTTKTTTRATTRATTKVTIRAITRATIKVIIKVTSEATPGAMAEATAKPTAKVRGATERAKAAVVHAVVTGDKTASEVASSVAEPAPSLHFECRLRERRGATTVAQELVFVGESLQVDMLPALTSGMTQQCSLDKLIALQRARGDTSVQTRAHFCHFPGRQAFRRRGGDDTMQTQTCIGWVVRLAWQ